MPPTPDEPMVRSPLFANSISSFSVRAGTDGLTAMTIGLFETVETPVKDFIGVSTVSKSPIVIAVNPSVPARTLKELIEFAKSGDLTMGSSGVGGIAHLAIEMFNGAGGAKAIHVPYTGGAPAATDVVAGHTKSLAMDLAPLQAFIEDGKMRAVRSEEHT